MADFSYGFFTAKWILIDFQKECYEDPLSSKSANSKQETSVSIFF